MLGAPDHRRPRGMALTLIALGLLLAACGPQEAAPAGQTTATPQTPSPEAAPPEESPSTPEAQPTATPMETPAPPIVEESADAVEETADSVQVVTVKIENGAVTSPERVEVALGTPLRIEVTSDAADEVHVHGYDITGQLEPGRTEAIEFVADVPGVFGVELHSTHSELFQLRVQ
ncbi:MAG TPA: hypothetical protein VML96_12050 [Egibacteraceae bacterium]|nr:hypothetical protein [Egibacteraceae bacterium]